MTDRIDENLSQIGGPRPLEADFRERLERALTDATAAGARDPERWTIDVPRPMRPEFRARLETTVIRGRAPRSWNRLIAAGIAAALVASTVVVANERLGAPRSHEALRGIPTQPAPSPRRVVPNGPDTLRGFSSKKDFLRYVRGEALALTGPYGLEGSFGSFGRFGDGVYVTGLSSGPAAVGGGAAQNPAPLAPSYAGGPASSGTNVQEEGVDEPDLVKTDGRRIVAIAGSKLKTLDVSGGAVHLRGSFDFQPAERRVAPPGVFFTPAQPDAIGLFLDGDRVILIRSQSGAPAGARRITHVLQREWTKVMVIDISSLSHPRLASSFDVEGGYVGARLAGGAIRLVVRSGALGPRLTAPTASTEQGLALSEARNRNAIRRSGVGDWVPHFVIERKGALPVAGHVHDWTKISRPPGRGDLGMLTILTIDPADPRPDNSVSVLGSGDIVYASLDNLYVTSYRLDDVIARSRSRAPSKPITRIHKFDIRDPKRAVYVGSGEVPGFLLNQFSLSERDGYLRVASTLEAPWIASEGASATQSSVIVLADKRGRLVPIGAVGHLGRGERIYSVRFVGPFGYVITFRQIDPLFVIDLRKPARPRLRGKLDMTGFSDYLHPISDTLLLGIGRAAGRDGIAKGLQFSVFDVSNPDRPRRLSVASVGVYGYSPVGTDHHAFLYWAPKRLVVVPSSLDNADYTHHVEGAMAVRMSSSGKLGTPFRLTHEGRPGTGIGIASILRSLVIGDRLITVSDFGVLSSDLDSFATLSWVRFR